MYVHALEAELPLTVHAINEALCLQCSNVWLHLAVHIMHNTIASDSEGVDMWKVSNDSAFQQKQQIIINGTWSIAKWQR